MDKKKINYWTRVNNTDLGRSIKDGQKAMADIEELYLEVLQRLETEITYYYDLMDDVNIGDSKKILTDAELKRFKRKIKDMLGYNISDTQMDILQKYSSRTRVSRLESMQVNILSELDIIATTENEILQDTMEKIYSRAYKRTLFNMGKEIGISPVFGSINHRLVQNLATHKWGVDNLTLSDRIWNRKDKVYNSLNTTLKQDLSLGVDPQKTINTVAEELGKSKRATGRLVMTESAYHTNRANMDAYDDLNVEQFQFIATLDDRTSDTCQEMDLQIFDLKDKDIGVNAPPLHPYCRSVTIPYYDDNKIKRFYRDKYGETGVVDYDMSYDEFEKEFL